MGRRNRLLFGTLPLIAMCLIVASSWAADEKTRKFDVSPGGTIEFDLESGGSVSIVGWDRSVAEISYSQRGRGRSHDVEISETDDGLRVATELDVWEDRSKSLSFEVRLPHRYNVEFESMGGGLHIEGLEGEFSGKTMGGGIGLTDTKGEVRLTTMGGSIEVTDCELDGDLHTMGGEVLLRNVIGDLEATSMGGNVQYKNVRGRDGERRAPRGVSAKVVDSETVTITTMGGDIDVDDAPEGAAVHTMGGDIDIRNAARFVKAKTMGGDIEIEVTDGWVKATTMAGDIHVDVEKGLGEGKEGVELVSCCGDITLMVPAGLSMDLDLTIAYTRNSSQDFEIISDWDLDIEHSKEWDYDNGSPRRRIYGTGEVKGGRYPIVIETINGNIYLKKAD